jgi:putative phosphonate metabolism protein
MSLFPRYALYYVPDAASELYRFGAELLGYDAFTGRPVTQPAMGRIANWPALTAEPRKYGFHATLKAPMALAEGSQESDLITALDSFAATPHDIPVIAPVVTMLGNFVAIVPATPKQALMHLADACVTEFDRFRAPLTDGERARRLNPSLTPRQITHVERWGYPYVFEDFRFHMTLTGRLPADQSDIVLAALRAQFERLAMTQIAVDAVGLFRQASADRNFEVIAHRALRPAFQA